MPVTSSSNDNVDDTLQQIKQVVKDLQSRPDYGDTQKKAVAELNGFALLLRKYEAATTPSKALTDEVKTSATDQILPLVSDLIDSNVEITKMGQLSAQRTITPTMAEGHNVNLEALQDDVQDVAVTPGGSSERDLDPDEAADLLLIDVMNIEMTSDPAIVESIEIMSGRSAPCSC